MPFIERIEPIAAAGSVPEGWLNRNIVGLGLASLFSDWNHEMATAILPMFLSGVLGAPVFALGLIEGVASGVSALFQIWAGLYSDRIGRRKGLAAAGYFVTAVSKASFALAGSWSQVLIGRTAGWVGRAVRSPVRDALLVESTRPATVSRAFAFHRTLDTLGAILGPLTATLLVAHVSLRAIFAISFIPGLCAVASIILLVKERPQRPNLSRPWHNVRALPRDFFWFMIPVGLFGISNFAPTLLILRAQDLLTPSMGTLAASAFSIGLYTFSNVIYALVAYPIGVLADRIDKRLILSAGFALFALVCLGFMFVATQWWLLGLLFALNGIYTAIVESSQPALASALMREDQHGAGFGVMSAIDGLGDCLSSIGLGALWSASSPATGFGVAALLAFMSAAMLSLMRLRPASGNSRS